MIRGAVLLAVLAAGCYLMFHFPFTRPSPSPAGDGAVNGAEAEAEQEAKERVPFAADRAQAGGGTALTIDGKRTMGYLHALCDIGARISGSPGMETQQELIRKHFTALGAKVQMQTFTARQVSKPQPVEMANLIVTWHPERTRRVILCAHYDTRPIADQEPDPRKWRNKFVSANDGGSGVAFLMELAHHMKDLKTSVGVDFVLFDGEEYIFEPKKDKYFFGSEHFAQTWRKSKPKVDYAAAILLDMIAGQNARFPVEGYSWFRAQRLVQDVWRIAGELKCNAFLDRAGERVLDDHIALLNAGIPAIDIIDFDYPHWHRLSDVADNCAPEAMIEVGKVLSVWLQRVK